MPKLRQNIVTGDWVVISPERSKRPEDYVTASSVKPKIIPQDCPFCLSNPNSAHQFAIGKAETNDIYVIPNKYPAFVHDDSVILEGDGFYCDTKSHGGHEVIILKNHDLDIYEDGEKVLNNLIETYRHRYNHYGQDPAVEYTMIIHNHGPEAGASIEHPHSQLFSSTIIPNYIEKELIGSKKYFIDKNECVFCKMAEVEKANKQRIVYENDHFIAFTAFAARFPFEIWIMPKHHAAHFENISLETQKSLANAMKETFTKLNKALNFPPFNYWIHTLPHNAQEADGYYHWHMEIAPRVSKFGGYEMGSGVVIDVVSPEMAAEFLRKA